MLDSLLGYVSPHCVGSSWEEYLEHSFGHCERQQSVTLFVFLDTSMMSNFFSLFCRKDER